MGGKADSMLGGLLSWNKKTSFLDRAQDVVDIVGIIDPTGVADAANAIGYAARGKWGAAAVSALGVVPYLGDSAKIAKYGARAAEVAKVAGKAGKAEGRLAKAAKLVSRHAKGFSKASKDVGKGVVRGTGRAAARGATRGTTKAAERGLTGRAFDTARKTKWVRRAEIGAKRKLGRYGRTGLKMATGEGKLRGRAAKLGKLASRAQKFRRSDAGKRIEKNVRAELSGDQPQTGPAARPRAGARPPRARGGGGASRGDRDSTEVPVDADCPGANTKTSTFRATPGMKRCNKQTPGRDHGD
jgi:hypothetical protein